MDEYDEDEADEREWGLEKGMELFEVSAKDDFGTSTACLSRWSAMTDAIVRRYLTAVRRADLGHHCQEGYHRPRKRSETTGKRDVDADCSPDLGSTGGRGRSTRKGGRTISHSPELLSIVALVGS